MNRQINKPKAIYNLVFPILFFISGFTGGLLGSGGGIFTVFALKRYFNSHVTNKYDGKSKEIFATSMAIILPMSAISSLFNQNGASMEVYSLTHYILPGLAGGIAAGILFERIKPSHLNTAFTLLMIIAGICMILK